MEGTTRAILRQVQSLGYRVRVESSYLVATKEGERLKVWLDDEAEDPKYKAACELAAAVGIDLEG